MSSKIGYLILAHEASDCLMRSMRILGRGNSRIALHLDASMTVSERREVFKKATAHGQVEEVEPIACKWGDWSLNEATLNGIRHLLDQGDEVSHIVLLSGSHFPIKPPVRLEEFLSEYPDKDFIEHHDSRCHNWVKRGEGLERFNFYFPINQREHPRAFNVLTGIQRKLGIQRRMPAGVNPNLGSQWWCLRKDTCNELLKRLDYDPSIERYFRMTWIPDECFFQSMVPAIRPRENIVNTAFVLHALNGFGRPYVFYQDHTDHLINGTSHFFARKISGESTELLNRLEANCVDDAESRDLHPVLPHELPSDNDMLSRHLAKNQLLDRPLPGHPHNTYRDKLKELTQTVIAIIAPGAGHQLTSTMESVSEEINGLVWLGRPYNRDAYNPHRREDILSMGAESKDIYEQFSHQLAWSMVSVTNGATMMVIDPENDDRAWKALASLRNFHPITLTDAREKQSVTALNQLSGMKEAFPIWQSTRESLVQDVADIITLGATSEGAAGHTVWKNIFILWDSSIHEAPRVVQRNWMMWKALNPDWKVHHYDLERLEKTIGHWPTHANEATTQVKAKALQLELLLQHGGIWVDATLLPTQPLNTWLLDALAGSGFFAYRSRQPSKRLLDNCLLAVAEPNHPIIRKWHRGYFNFWKHNWAPCDPHSEAERTYRKASVGRMPKFRADDPPHYTMHHIFNQLYESDSEVHRLWNVTTTMRPAKMLRPGRKCPTANPSETREAIFLNDAPVMKLADAIHWPNHVIDEHCHDVLVRHKGVSKSLKLPTLMPAKGQLSCDAAAKQKDCFVIYTNPRCGSYLLVDLLNRLSGVECLGEVFKPDNIELPPELRKQLPDGIQERNANPLGYLARCISLTQQEHAGFKLFTSHIDLVGRYVLSSPHFKKILLSRNNFDTYISLMRAEKSGIWLDRGKSAEPEDPSFVFDSHGFEQHLRRCNESAARFTSYSTEYPDHFIQVEYEEIVNREAFSRICPFLGLPMPSVGTLQSDMQKQVTEPLTQLVRNHAEMRAYLSTRHPELMPYLEAKS